MSSNFLNNCNIMLFIFFIVLLISLTLYIASIFVPLPKIREICVKFMKQGIITFIMFNCFNISFSAGLHWKIADQFHDKYYGFGSFLILISFLIILISILSMFFTNKSGFGEFKNKFKKNNASQLFIPI